MTAFGDELFSGWSDTARTAALMTVLTNFVAARVLAGSTIEMETAKLSQYLTNTVAPYLAEIDAFMEAVNVQ